MTIDESREAPFQPRIGEVALTTVTMALAQRAHVEAECLFNELRATSVDLYDTRERSYSLRSITKVLIQARLLKQARTIATGIDDAVVFAHSLSDIAVALTNERSPESAAVFQEAMVAAVAIENISMRANALRIIAAALADVERFEDALATVNDIKPSSIRAASLRDIAIGFAKRGRLEEARKTAYDIDDARLQAYALSHIAATIEHIDDRVASALFEEAQATVIRISDARERANALRIITLAIAHAKRFEQALNTVTRIDDARERAMSLRGIAVELYQVDNYAALEVFERAKATVIEIDDPSDRADVLSAISGALAKVEQFEQAELVAMGIDDHFARLEAFGAIARAFIEVRRFAEAEAIVRVIEGVELSDYLRRLANSLANAHQFSDPTGSFATLGLDDLDTFIQSIAEWQEGFERVQPGLSLRILRETLRIASWVQPSWGEIAKLLEEDDPPAVA